MKNASILLVLLLALVSTTSTVNGLRVKAMKGSGDKDKDKDKSTRSADKASSSGDKASRSSRDKSSSSTVSSAELCRYVVLGGMEMGPLVYKASLAILNNSWWYISLTFLSLPLTNLSEVKPFRPFQFQFK